MEVRGEMHLSAGSFGRGLRVPASYREGTGSFVLQ